MGNLKTKTVIIMIDETMHNELATISKEQERPMAWIIRKAIQQAIDARKAIPLQAIYPSGDDLSA